MKLDLHCMECYPFLNLEPWPLLTDKWFSKYLEKNIKMSEEIVIFDTLGTGAK